VFISISVNRVTLLKSTAQKVLEKQANKNITEKLQKNKKPIAISKKIC